jgi:glutamate synthase domain-containing protein 1
MVFLPNDDKLEAASRQILEDVVAAEGRCRVVGWRKVPVDREVVGRLARVTEPRIWQVGPTAVLKSSGSENFFLRLKISFCD